MSDTALDTALRRDRWIIAGGLAVLAVLAWGYTAWMAAPAAMPDMASMAMPEETGWGATEFLVVFVMWAVMMAAMMVPSVAPVVLLYAATQRRRTTGAGYLAVALFAAGYLAVWTGFSLVATVAQGVVHMAALAADDMGPVSRPLAAAILIVAGVYQFTPLKNVCLAHCRSPLAFFMTHWRAGSWGAFTMGLRHGAYCVGCCWPLMLLLFVVGVMNLLWIAALAAFVLVEKLVPRGDWVGRAGGLVFLAWGVALAVTG
jgi:predicted metal-binding membrane protein